MIADHLRASAFLIADGVLPSNEGRGYVLRRIMRRAMRHAELLGAKDPLMFKLVPALTREMGQAYPELIRAEALITETLKLEETRFRQMLVRGLTLLDEESKGLKKGDMFDGNTAFTLYDTYGFPLDLTQDALRARGIGVDLASFTDAMEAQRAKARESWKGSGEAAQETVWLALREKVGPTEFLGYETESAEGVVAALVKDGKEVPELKKGESGAVLVNQTPFYGESGGQVGDQGEIRRDGLRATVTDTQKKAGDLFAHMVKVGEGTLKVGDPVLLEVDHARRAAIRQNHSATHLLHEALRQVLGDHVAQKGSLVAPDRLRFDFSHPKPISADELERVEDIANDIVLQNSPGHHAADGAGRRRRVGRARAVRREIRRRGARGGDGHTRRLGTGNMLGWSVELCGGTHVKRTGDIGIISVLSDSGVAAGVRRIEALTGKAARKSANKQVHTLKAVASELKVPPEEMPARIAALLDERKKFERDLVRRAQEDGDGRRGRRQGGSGVRRAPGQWRQIPGARGLRHQPEGPPEPGR